MTLTIYPAIDIRGGKCVRLEQGDFEKETVFFDDPLDAARNFHQQGAEWLHLVDLDGAKAGRPENIETIKNIIDQVPVKVQVGGGVRTEAAISDYIKAGVDRIILGSAAVRSPEWTRDMLSKYKSRLAIGIDARGGRVAIEGWTETSTVLATDLGQTLARAGAETFIYTDIEKDGMLNGANVEAIAELAEATGAEVIASGGVSSLHDVKRLAAARSKGVSGAIIGKALYTGTLTLTEALEGAE